MAIKTLTVVVDNLNVRNRPATKGKTKGDIVGMLRRGDKVQAFVKGVEVVGEWIPGQGDMGLKSPYGDLSKRQWVYINKPIKGWVVGNVGGWKTGVDWLCGGDRPCATSKPKNGGMPDAPISSAPLTPAAGGMGAMGFLVVAALAYYFLGRGK